MEYKWPDMHIFWIFPQRSRSGIRDFQIFSQRSRSQNRDLEIPQRLRSKSIELRSIRDWFVSKKRFLEKLDFASKITETFHHGAEKMWQPPPKFSLPLLHQFRKCLFPLWRKHPEYSKTHQQFVFNIWGSYGQGWRITLIIISIIFTCEFWFASVTGIVYQW